MSGPYVMSISEIANDIAQVWGYPTFAAVPAFGKDRIRIEINAAIQEMQDSGEDFFGREDIEITLVAGQESYVLDAVVQSVLEPITLQDGTPLRKLTSQGQVLHFGQLFQDRLNNNVPDGKPEAYYVDAKREPTGSDNVRTILQFLPAPSAPNIANKPVVPVIKEADLFSNAEITAGTASLPIPHKYVESIFLPLARYGATTCYLFYKKESGGKYQTDYDRALQLLGKADPRSPKPPDSNTAALQTRPPSG